MSLTKYSMGDLIEPTVETNSEGLFNSSDVKGMTITKEIIPTKANVTDTDLTKFLVIHPEEFVFNPRTHGKRIGFGYNDTTDSFIISWNNIGFRIKPEMRKAVLPKYLFLHFNRQEWDREACFRSWGSSTEVFSWDALCEMELDLPQLPIQQKYVDIYNAMLANQQSYERGLEDLKLVCDAYIEKIRKTIPYSRLGDYISLCSQTNENLAYGAEAVRGISIEKKFIDTKANMDGVSLRPYFLVNPNEFAYVTVTSRNGGKISLARNDSNETYICSSSYVAFKIDDTDCLLPEYLSMLFERSEFDRYARFNSWGSARETFDWTEMCDVEIPVPKTEIQQDIGQYLQIIQRSKSKQSETENSDKGHLPDIDKRLH